MQRGTHRENNHSKCLLVDWTPVRQDWTQRAATSKLMRRRTDIRVFLILVTRDHHLLECAQASQNRPPDPGRIFSLRWREYPQFDVLESELLDLTQQPITKAYTINLVSGFGKTKDHLIHLLSACFHRLGPRWRKDFCEDPSLHG
jgi:hypothetical protein